MGLKLRSLGTSRVLVAILVMAVFMAELGMVSAALSAAQCHELRILGINACKPVMAGFRPSSDCCYRIRVTPLECVCPSITPERAAIIRSFPQVFQMIRNCGRIVPRHYRCGSITTP